MKKGLSKFLMKQIYLIIAILSIVLVVNQVVSLTRRNAQSSQLIDFRSQSNDILNTMLSSTECLAREYNGQMIVDEENLDQFQQVFSDVEPNCVKSYEYGYSIKVEKYNNTLKRGKYWEPEIPVGNRDIVLIVDNSGSMEEKSMNTDPTPKIQYAKKAVKEFVACANETDRISLLTFGPGLCGVTDLMAANGLPTFVQLDSNATKEQVVALIESGISPEAGTPIISSVESGIDIIREYSDPDKNRLIILFTDGRETCCEDCRDDHPDGCEGGSCKLDFKHIRGTCCCIDACQNAVCSHSSTNLDYIIDQEIPIFSIFLGTDMIGSQQVKCISNKTGGENFTVDDPAILPSLFCEMVGSREPEVEYYQKWSFGSQVHSEGDLLRSTFTATSPLMIMTNDLTLQPGLLTLTLYDGELEETVGLIRSVCETGNELEKRMYFSSPVEFRDGEVCMTNKGNEICKRVLCDSEISFDGIESSGSYLVRVVKTRDLVEVIV